MVCKKCGNVVNENTKFCNQCGNNIVKDNYDFNNKKIVCLFICICGFLLIGIGLIIYNNENNKYYFSETPEKKQPNIEQEEKEDLTKEKKNKYQTSIIYDTHYDGVNVSNKEDAILLIEKY